MITVFNVLSFHPAYGDLYFYHYEEGTPPSPPTVDFLLQENGDAILQEDGSNIII